MNDIAKVHHYPIVEDERTEVKSPADTNEKNPIKLPSTSLNYYQVWLVSKMLENNCLHWWYMSQDIEIVLFSGKNTDRCNV